MPAAALALFALCCPQQPAARTYALHGEVVDMRGEPLAGATVWAAPSGHHDDRSRAVKSDANGHFRIAGIPRTFDWRVHAVADGHCRVSQWTGAGPKPVRITLQQAVTLQGLVRAPDGLPVAGARVFAQPMHRLLGSSVVHTTTDDDGWFVLKGVALDQQRIGAWSDRHGLAQTTLDVREPDEVSLRFGRDQRVRLRVTLTGLTAEELQHAVVGVSTQTFGSTPEHVAPFRSHLRGRNVLELLVPNEKLGVHPEGLGVRFAPSRTGLDPKSAPHDVTFAARKPPQVRTRQRVRLLDGNGVAIAGVRTAMYGADGQPPAPAISDDDGWLTFELRIAAGKHGWLYLRDGRWLIADAAPLGSADKSHRFVVAPDRAITLDLLAACSVAGQVVRSDGQPAAFTEVELQHEVGGHWQRYATTISNANGDFACDQLQTYDGNLRVAVRGRHGSIAHTAERLQLGRPGTQVQLGKLQLAPPAVVTGVVADRDGKPLPGVFVSLHGKRETSDYHENAVTDAEGRFRFVGVPPGKGEVYVRTDGGRRSAYEVGEGEHFEWQPDGAR